MTRRSPLIVILLMLFAFLSIVSANAQTTYYSRQDGNWNTLATWSLTSHTVTNAPASLPTASDIILIGGSHDVTIPQNYTALAASVTVSDDESASSNLFIGNNTATNAAATLTISGNLTINTGGAVRLGASTNNAARTGVLNAVDIDLNGSAILVLGNTNNNAGVTSTVSASGNITLNGTSVLTVGSLVSNNNTNSLLTCAGAVTIGLSAALQSGSNGGGNHTINFQSTLGNSGTINFANGTDNVTLTVTGATNSSGSVSFGINTGVKTFIGAVTNSGTWTSTALTTTNNLVFRNGISSTGAFAAGGATFNTNNQAIGGTTAMSFGNTVTVETGMTLTNTNTNTVTMNELTFAANAANSSVSMGTGATLTITNAITFNNPSANNVSQELSVNNGSVVCGSIAMANCTNGTRTNNVVVGSDGILTVTGNITTAGAANENFLTLNDIGTLNIGGAFTGGTFDVSATSTVRWFGDNTNFRNVTTIATGYGNLIIEKPAIGATNRVKTMTDAVTVRGNFTIGSLHATSTVSLSPAGNNFTVDGLTFVNARGLFTDATNAGTNTFGGLITVAANGSFSAGANSPVVFQSGIANEGTVSLTTTGLVSFTGAGDKNISGNGTFTLTLTNLTLTTSGAANVVFDINSNVSVGGVLTFSADGLLVIGTNSNLHLSTAAASIIGAGANRYIQLDGTDGANSQMIKTTNNNVNTWRILYPIGTATGGYTPLDLSTATITTAPTNNSTLAVKALFNIDKPNWLRRSFRLIVAGNASATTFTNAVFSYNAASDVASGNAIGEYTSIWYLNVTLGTWASVTGTAPGAGSFTGPGTAQTLSNGTYFYTIGSNSPFQSWYSYQSGFWDNPDNWTQDPTGTTLVNPFNAYPVAGDVVVILNGFTITNNLNNQELTSLTIEGGGTLNIGSTTGNNLGTVSGSGILRINGVELPNGNYTSFVTNTGGTIEYYNTGGTLPVSQTVYNNLLLSNTTNSPITFVSANNLTINSNLNITQTSGTGTVTWQINDATNIQRALLINGNLTISASGQIRVGTGNSGSTTPHQLSILGDISNSGSVKFFDATDATLSDANYTSRAVFSTALRGNTVSVTFTGLNGTMITCNNQTDFYRLILDKGTGRQAILTINSSSTNNFRLFGPNTELLGGAYPNLFSNNALSIINGTLELTGNINIPSLCETQVVNGGFAIPQNGAFWLNGANVTVQLSPNTVETATWKYMEILGLLRITAGTMNSGYSVGLLGSRSGQFVIEGGTVNTVQLRTVQNSAGNFFSYTQTGGTVNVGTPGLVGATSTNAPRFSIPFPACSFNMSGGTLNVGDPINGGVANNGGILIAATSANIQVTGGTVNAFIPASGINFNINSTAPFYNLIIHKDGAGAGTATLAAQDATINGVTLNFLIQPLTILNNLVLTTGNDPIFNCNGSNLTVGGNLDVQLNTTFTPGANTITFNGAGAQTWTHNGAITSLANVIVNKSAGTLTLAGSQIFPNITGTTAGLALSSGTLHDGGKILTVTGAMSNSATHTGAGSIVYNRAGASTVGGSNGTFGNLTIQSDNTVSTSGSHIITGTLRLLNGNTSLNIGSYSLTALGNIFSDAATGTAFSATKRIITNGLRNDGGLIRSASSGVDLLFPVGSTTVAFTPATINVSASTTGSITVRPVSVTHPNVTTVAQSVRYYWRVTSSGFSGISNVLHKSYTYAGATRDAASGSYVPARYDPATFSWAYGIPYDATNVPGTTTIPDFNTATGWTDLATTQLDGEYTAGNTTAFGTVTVYYSRASANWSLNTTWSTDNTLRHTGAAAASAPCATCPVVIGDGAANNHVVVNNANNQACGSLFIALGSTLDCASATGLNFGVNTSGTGTLRRSTNSFPIGDFTDFIASGGGTVEYYGNSFTIPTTGPAPQSLNLINYNNLRISPNTGQTITFPLVPTLTIYNNLTISGGGTGQASTNVTATATRTIEIQGALNVVSGRLNLENNGAANATTFIINGNTTIDNEAFMTVNTAGTAATHTIQSFGSITNNGTLDLNGGGNRVADLTFRGSNNASLSGSNAGGADLNLVTIDKGSSQAPTLTFDMSGSVTLLANNWLTLQNGTFNYNRAATTMVLTNTAANPYLIPATAKLRSQAGTVNISNIGDNGSDLLLAGTLEVAGGTVNVGPLATNFNNDIEYASAGTPTITVSSGSLYVNGSIRRATTALAGSLVYNQSGGTVIVGGRASDNTRGVFEIENNSGSSFTMTGDGTLTVVRPTNGTAFPDLYLTPASANVASTSTIEIGSNALGAQTLDFSITPVIGNITILGAAGNTQTVNMESNTLTVAGTLTINTTSILNTNSLDVTIGGDLTILGTGAYNGNNNTTTFNGTGTQTGALTAASNFNNITINKATGTALLSGTTSITNLNILSGILSNSGTLNVNGNIVNNSSQVGAGFIVLTGSSATHTITSANGSFTNLTVGTGATTKDVTVVGNMTIDGVLNFAATNRYLTIGSNQLLFSSNATVTGAGATAFIRTNGVASDLGVVRNWPAGNTSFTYPLGTGSSYIPIAFTLDVNALGAGTLTIVPIAQKHPTYNLGSSERILNYYWVVTRGSSLIYTNTGSHVYSYASGLLSGTGGTLAAGILDVANPTGWITSAHGGVANTTTMTFTNLLNTNLPATGNTFHYTVGTANTLPNPIVPVYSRLSDPSVADASTGGNWNSVNSWTTDPSGFGAPTAGPPIGIPVFILPGARINMTTNARTAFTSVINGTLVTGTTSAHNLGNISGSGTLRVATNTFPAGNYTAFVAPGGGTIEYVAPMTMNSRNTYNNLSIFSGSSGTVTMTNTDLIVNGNLTIPTGVVLDNSANNRNITIAGNWTNTGSFTAGTGSVIFSSIGGQSINGTTTFNRLVVSKTTGNLTLSGSGVTTVNTNLTLASGSIISSSSHLLALGVSTTLTGGGSTSLISGPMTKVLNSSGAFTFPVGNVTGNVFRPVNLASTSAPDTWRVEYVQQNPNTGGYSINSINTDNLAKVSKFEYWLVSRSGSSAADLTLSYNTGSYEGSDIGNVDNLKVAHWDGAIWDLPSGGGVLSQLGDATQGTVTITNVTDFSPLTLGSTDADSPLPVELIKFTGKQIDNRILFTWETASELNNDYFTLERLQEDDTFGAIAKVQGKGTTNELSKYQAFDDAPNVGKNYYALKQTDFDGTVVYSNVVMVEFQSVISDFSVYPNPLRNETLHIEIKGLKNEQIVPIRIISAIGVLISETRLVADETGTIKSTVDAGSLKTGVYLVRAGDDDTLQKKLVVE